MIACIPPTLEGWVYIIPIHGPLGGPLYTWAQYTPTYTIHVHVYRQPWEMFIESQAING